MLAEVVDEEVIILMSAREAYRKPPVPLSALVTADCGHKAFMAPTTVAFLADGREVRTVCTACFDPADMVEDPELRLIPGTAAEAEAVLGVAEADQMMSWVRDLGFK